MAGRPSFDLQSLTDRFGITITDKDLSIMWRSRSLNIFLRDHMLGNRNFLSSFRPWEGSTVKCDRSGTLNPQILQSLNVGAEPESEPVKSGWTCSWSEVAAHQKELGYLLQCEVPISPQAVFVSRFYQGDEFRWLERRNILFDHGVDPAPVVHRFLTDSSSPLQDQGCGVSVDHTAVPKAPSLGKSQNWADVRSAPLCPRFGLRRGAWPGRKSHNALVVVDPYWRQAACCHIG